MSKRTTYTLTDRPRLDQVTRHFKAPKHMCPQCKLTSVTGKVRCDGCVDQNRSDKAATEMRFLARDNPIRFKRVLAEIRRRFVGL
jgi:hypothetical protein